ncbi:MAG TPA: aspartate/glutamate racemase family protein [Cellulomonas sp.]
MRTILIIAPVGSDAHLAVEEAEARTVLGSGTTLVLRHLTGVPPTVYVAPEEVFVPRLVEAVVQGAADGFDAIGISCCSDPGLAECRAAVDVPVTAPFAAVASRLAETGPIGILYQSVPPAPGESELTGDEWIPRLAAAYGCAEDIVAAIPVPVGRTPIDYDTPGATPAAVGAALVHQMRSAMDSAGVVAAREAQRHGARAIFPTCTYWSGTLDTVRAAVDIPVLDPLAELTRHLDQLARDPRPQPGSAGLPE